MSTLENLKTVKFVLWVRFRTSHRHLQTLWKYEYISRFLLALYALNLRSSLLNPWFINLTSELWLKIAKTVWTRLANTIYWKLKNHSQNRQGLRYQSKLKFGYVGRNPATFFNHIPKRRSKISQEFHVELL